MASLAMSYEVETGVSVNEAELKCMAENIYFEGRAEPMIGKIAIGHVVMNRIEDKRFPDTICGVVHQGPLADPMDPRQYRGYLRGVWCHGMGITQRGQGSRHAGQERLALSPSRVAAQAYREYSPDSDLWGRDYVAARDGLDSNGTDRRMAVSST
mgnify:CR=1 FL=1